MTESILLLLALGIGRLSGSRPFADLTFNPVAIAAGVGAVLPTGLFVAWSLRSQLRFFVELRERSKRQLSHLFAHCAVWELVLISLCAGVVEEALLRGVVQQAIGGWIHPAAGLLAGGALFAALHWISLRYAVLAGLLGMWWGWLYLLTGSLLTAVIGHALHDMVAFYLHRRNIKNPPA